MTLVADRKKSMPRLTDLRRGASGDVVVFCPQCKALQTVQIAGNRLTPTRKFTQSGSHIYHDCGSTQPCRMYHHM